MYVEVIQAEFDPALVINNGDELTIRWSFNEAYGGYTMERPLLNGKAIGSDPTITVTWRDVPETVDLRPYQRLQPLLPRELRDYVQHHQEFPPIPKPKSKGKRRVRLISA